MVNRPAGQIEELVRDLACGEYGREPHTVEVVQKWQRPYSEISVLQLVWPGRTRRLVTKQNLPHPSNRWYAARGNGAQAEFDILRFLAPRFSASQFGSVPFPHLVVPQLDLYVMEFVEGPLLEQRMRAVRWLNSQISLNQLAQTFFQAGAWLRQFQQFTGIEWRNATAMQSAIEHCEIHLQAIEQLNDRRTPRHLRAVVTGALERWRHQIDRPLPVAGCHGDFGPWNLLVRWRGMTVLDFFTYRRDFIALDSLNVLVTLQNAAQAFSSSGRRVEQLQTCFLSGLDPALDLDPAALAIGETLYRLGSVYNCLQIRSRRLRDRLRARRVLEFNLHRLLHPTTAPRLWPDRLPGYLLH